MQSPGQWPARLRRSRQPLTAPGARIPLALLASPPRRTTPGDQSSVSASPGFRGHGRIPSARGCAVKCDRRRRERRGFGGARLFVRSVVKKLWGHVIDVLGQHVERPRMVHAEVAILQQNVPRVAPPQCPPFAGGSSVPAGSSRLEARSCSQYARTPIGTGSGTPLPSDRGPRCGTESAQKSLVHQVRRIPGWWKR